MSVSSTNACLILLGTAFALWTPRVSRSQDAPSAEGSTVHYFPGASEAREEWLNARLKRSFVAAPAAEPPSAPQAGLPSSPLDAVENIADSMSVIGDGPGVRVKLMPSIRAAAEAVRDADQAARSEAQGRLTKLLEKYFDDDMARRKQELALIEQRLSQFREQLDRRSTKKREIIELQAKVALNDAEGLGFYLGEAQAGASADTIPGALPATDPTLIRQ